jgi:hypothetical protein
VTYMFAMALTGETFALAGLSGDEGLALAAPDGGEDNACRAGERLRCRLAGDRLVAAAGSAPPDNELFGTAPPFPVLLSRSLDSLAACSLMRPSLSAAAAAVECGCCDACESPEDACINRCTSCSIWMLSLRIKPVHQG